MFICAELCWESDNCTLYIWSQVYSSFTDCNVLWSLKLYYAMKILTPECCKTLFKNFKFNTAHVLLSRGLWPVYDGKAQLNLGTAHDPPKCIIYRDYLVLMELNRIEQAVDNFTSPFQANCWVLERLTCLKLQDASETNLRIVQIYLWMPHSQSSFYRLKGFAFAIQHRRMDQGSKNEVSLTTFRILLLYLLHDIIDTVLYDLYVYSSV